MADSVSGLSGTGGGDMMRLVGLATGMDIDGMVRKMMLAEEAKVDKVKQQKQAVLWKQEIYQDIIKDIKDLQNSYFDVSNPESFVKSSKYYNVFEANGIDENILSVSGSIGAVAGKYTVNVSKLATKATIEGSKLTEGTTLSKKLSELDGTMGDSQDITLNYSGTSKTITLTKDMTLDQALSKINSETGGKVTAKFSELTGKVTFQTSDTGNTSKLSISSDIKAFGMTGNFYNGIEGTALAANPSLDTTMETLGFANGATKALTLNFGSGDLSINISSSDKVSDVVNLIKAKDPNLDSSFDETTKKFKIWTKDNASLQVSDGISELGIANGANGNMAIGSDAVVKITPPGSSTAIDVTKSGNTFTIDNVEYKLTDLGETSFTLTEDTQKLYDKIDGFIKKYNAVVDKIQTRLTEKKDLNYKPLTDAQKKEMKEEEIKAWEDRAKKGILKGDNNLQTILSDLRSAFMTGVEGVTLSVGKYGSNSIGIDTASWQDNGKMSIVDPQKLKESISKYGNEFIKLFNKSFVPDDAYNNEADETKKAAYKLKNQGIFQRIDDILTKNVGIVKTSLNNAILTKYANKQQDFSMYGTSSTNTLPDQIYRKDNLIKTMTSKLAEKENRLYNQFARLESAMNNYNSQSSWLAQQFS